MNRDWVADALCAQVDTNLFFPETPGSSSLAAKRICAECPVKLPCREWAIENNEWGIWGGLSWNQRRQQRSGPHIEHGTAAGARAHYRIGERPCRDCAAAALQYDRNRRKR